MVYACRLAAARRLISASRSQIVFDSVALRLRTPLLKLGKVANPGHLPDMSTNHPCATPNPASRRAALNSAAVICDFFLTGCIVLPQVGIRLSHHAADDTVCQC